MMQCSQCEFCRRDERGNVGLFCDPFATIKEPECLQKWQLMATKQMVEAYQSTLRYYEKLAPMQDKLFRAMERELDDIDEAEKWKQDDDDGTEGDQDRDISSPGTPL